MNYYIQGNKESADQIKAAFEKLGYDITYPDGCANPAALNIGVEIDGAKFVVPETLAYIHYIIKTHPDYKELELPVAKFKVGDWIHQHRVGIFKIIEICESWYEVIDKFDRHYSISFEQEKNCTLWSITDANDGDVLVSKLDAPFIYDGNIRHSFVGAYVGVSSSGDEIIRADMFTTRDWTSAKGVKPATKEQHDLLFAKMREAGYEWDADKKELKKIHPHYDISNFKPFQEVLVRDSNGLKWTADLFSYIDDGFVCTGGIPCRQCIPYNDDTKHLLGTTDMCPEEYINW